MESIVGEEIKPVIIPLVEEPGNVVKRILYPLRIYELEVTIKKLVGEPRRLRLFVQVDMIRAKGLLSDSIPETQPLPGEAMKPVVTPQQAERIARRTALYYTLKKYRVGIAPEIRVVRVTDAFKLFWVTRDTNGYKVVDSITGDYEELESP